MSFCRITGKSRGLPKPNYFPLLPPISPADAKRFCRITNKSQGLPGHHFIPALLSARSLRAHCRVTAKSEGQAPHHFPTIEGAPKPHDIIPGYKYVFPKFDVDHKLQQRILSLITSKTVPGESNARYVYAIDERLTGLVIPAGFEAAVRDGEIRDVMLDKDKDTMLVKLHHGPSVTIDVTNLVMEEGMILWDGMGPSQAVLKQREKEEQEMEERKKKRQEGLSSKKRIFEDKEKAAEEEETELAKIKEARKSKVVKVKMRGGAEDMDVMVDSGPTLEDNFNGVDGQPVFGHIVQTATAVEFFPGDSILNLPEGKVVPGRLIRNADGVKFVPGIMSDDRFIPGQVVMTNSGEQFVPGQVVDTRDGPKFVPGQVAETISGPKFVPGQTIETEDGPQFVPGQIIETKAGPTFIPGQIIVTDDEPRFVPGRVVETAEGPRFVPGRVIESGDQVTFVSGQVVETSEGLKFIAPDLEYVPDGGHEFSVQGFEVTPEELKLLRPAGSCDPAETSVFTVDSKMLRQLSEAGMSVGRQVPTKLPEVDISPLPVVVEKLKLNGPQALQMSRVMTVLSQVALKISERSDLCASEIPLDEDAGDKILLAVKKNKDLGKYLQAIVASSVVAARNNFDEESLLNAVATAMESALSGQYDNTLTQESILSVIGAVIDGHFPGKNAVKQSLLAEISAAMEGELRTELEGTLTEDSLIAIFSSVLESKLGKENSTRTKGMLLEAVTSAVKKEQAALYKEHLDKESFLAVVNSTINSGILGKAGDVLSKEALLTAIRTEIEKSEASGNEWSFSEESILSIINAAIESEASAKGVTLNNGTLPAAIMASIKKNLSQKRECSLTEDALLACITSVIEKDLPEGSVSKQSIIQAVKEEVAAQKSQTTLSEETLLETAFAAIEGEMKAKGVTLKNGTLTAEIKKKIKKKVSEKKKSSLTEETLMDCIASVIEKELPEAMTGSVTKQSIIKAVKKKVAAEKSKKVISEGKVISAALAAFEKAAAAEGVTLPAAVKTKIKKKLTEKKECVITEDALMSCIASAIEKELPAGTAGSAKKQKLLQAVMETVAAERSGMSEEKLLATALTALEKAVTAEGVTFNNGTLPAEIMTRIKNELTQKKESSLTDEALMACIASVIEKELPEGSAAKQTLLQAVKKSVTAERSKAAVSQEKLIATALATLEKAASEKGVTLPADIIANIKTDLSQKKTEEALMASIASVIEKELPETVAGSDMKHALLQAVKETVAAEKSGVSEEKMLATALTALQKEAAAKGVPISAAIMTSIKNDLSQKKTEEAVLACIASAIEKELPEGVAGSAKKQTLLQAVMKTVTAEQSKAPLSQEKLLATALAALEKEAAAEGVTLSPAIKTNIKKELSKKKEQSVTENTLMACIASVIEKQLPEEIAGSATKQSIMKAVKETVAAEKSGMSEEKMVATALAALQKEAAEKGVPIPAAVMTSIKNDLTQKKTAETLMACIASVMEKELPEGVAGSDMKHNLLQAVIKTVAAEQSKAPLSEEKLMATALAALEKEAAAKGVTLSPTIKAIINKEMSQKKCSLSEEAVMACIASIVEKELPEGAKQGLLQAVKESVAAEKSVLSEEKMIAAALATLEKEAAAKGVTISSAVKMSIKKELSQKKEQSLTENNLMACIASVIENQLPEELARGDTKQTLLQAVKESVAAEQSKAVVSQDKLIATALAALEKEASAKGVTLSPAVKNSIKKELAEKKAGSLKEETVMACIASVIEKELPESAKQTILEAVKGSVVAEKLGMSEEKMVATALAALQKEASAKGVPLSPVVINSIKNDLTQKKTEETLMACIASVMEKELPEGVAGSDMKHTILQAVMKKVAAEQSKTPLTQEKLMATALAALEKEAAAKGVTISPAIKASIKKEMSQKKAGTLKEETLMSCIASIVEKELPEGAKQVVLQAVKESVAAEKSQDALSEEKLLATAFAALEKAATAEGVTLNNSSVQAAVMTSMKKELLQQESALSEETLMACIASAIEKDLPEGVVGSETKQTLLQAVKKSVAAEKSKNVISEEKLLSTAFAALEKAVTADGVTLTNGTVPADIMKTIKKELSLKKESALTEETLMECIASVIKKELPEGMTGSVMEQTILKAVKDSVAVEKSQAEKKLVATAFAALEKAATAEGVTIPAAVMASIQNDLAQKKTEESLMACIASVIEKELPEGAAKQNLVKAVKESVAAEKAKTVMSEEKMLETALAALQKEASEKGVTLSPAVTTIIKKELTQKKTEEALMASIASVIEKELPEGVAGSDMKHALLQAVKETVAAEKSGVSEEKMLATALTALQKEAAAKGVPISAAIMTSIKNDLSQKKTEEALMACIASVIEKELPEGVAGSAKKQTLLQAVMKTVAAEQSKTPLSQEKLLATALAALEKEAASEGVTLSPAIKTNIKKELSKKKEQSVTEETLMSCIASVIEKQLPEEIAGSATKQSIMKAVKETVAAEKSGMSEEKMVATALAALQKEAAEKGVPIPAAVMTSIKNDLTQKKTADTLMACIASVMEKELPEGVAGSDMKHNLLQAVIKTVAAEQSKAPLSEEKLMATALAALEKEAAAKGVTLSPTIKANINKEMSQKKCSLSEEAVMACIASIVEKELPEGATQGLLQAVKESVAAEKSVLSEEKMIATALATLEKEAAAKGVTLSPAVKSSIKKELSQKKEQSLTENNLMACIASVIEKELPEGVTGSENKQGLIEAVKVSVAAEKAKTVVSEEKLLATALAALEKEAAAEGVTLSPAIKTSIKNELSQKKCSLSEEAVMACIASVIEKELPEGAATKQNLVKAVKESVAAEKPQTAVSEDKLLATALTALEKAVTAEGVTLKNGTLPADVMKKIKKEVSEKKKSSLTEETVMACIAAAIEKDLPEGAKGSAMKQTILQAVKESVNAEKTQEVLSEEKLLATAFAALEKEATAKGLPVNNSALQAAVMTSVKKELQKDTTLSEDAVMACIASVIDKELPGVAGSATKETLLQAVKESVTAEKSQTLSEEELLATAFAAIKSEMTAKGVTLKNGTLPADIMKSIKKEVSQKKESALTEETLMECIASVIKTELPKGMTGSATEQSILKAVKESVAAEKSKKVVTEEKLLATAFAALEKTVKAKQDILPEGEKFLQKAKEKIQEEVAVKHENAEIKKMVLQNMEKAVEKKILETCDSVLNEEMALAAVNAAINESGSQQSKFALPKEKMAQVIKTAFEKEKSTNNSTVMNKEKLLAALQEAVEEEGLLSNTSVMTAFNTALEEKRKEKYETPLTEKVITSAIDSAVEAVLAQGLEMKVSKASLLSTVAAELEKVKAGHGNVTEGRIIAAVHSAVKAELLAKGETATIEKLLLEGLDSAIEKVDTNKCHNLLKEGEVLSTLESAIELELTRNPECTLNKTALMEKINSAITDKKQKKRESILTESVLLQCTQSALIASGESPSVMESLLTTINSAIEEEREAKRLTEEAVVQAVCSAMDSELIQNNKISLTRGELVKLVTAAIEEQRTEEPLSEESLIKIVQSTIERKVASESEAHLLLKAFGSAIEKERANARKKPIAEKAFIEIVKNAIELSDSTLDKEKLLSAIVSSVNNEVTKHGDLLTEAAILSAAYSTIQREAEERGESAMQEVLLSGIDATIESKKDTKRVVSEDIILDAINAIADEFTPNPESKAAVISAVTSAIDKAKLIKGEPAVVHKKLLEAVSGAVVDHFSNGEGSVSKETFITAVCSAMAKEQASKRGSLMTKELLSQAVTSAVEDQLSKNPGLMSIKETLLEAANSAVESECACVTEKHLTEKALLSAISSSIENALGDLPDVNSLEKVVDSMHKYLSENLDEVIVGTVNYMVENESAMDKLNYAMNNAGNTMQVIEKLSSVLNDSMGEAFQKLSARDPSLLRSVIQLLNAEKVSTKEEVTEALQKAIVGAVRQKSVETLRSLREDSDDKDFKELLLQSVGLAKALGMKQVASLLLDVVSDSKSHEVLASDETVIDILQRLTIMRQFAETKPELASALTQLISDPELAKRDPGIRELVRHSTALMTVPEETLRSSADIPASLLASGDTFAMEQFLAKARRPRTLVIVKYGMQAVVPKEAAHAVLTGQVPYAVLDERSIRYFEPLHVFSTMKLPRYAAHCFSMYRCPETDRDSSLTPSSSEDFTSRVNGHRKSSFRRFDKPFPCKRVSELGKRPSSPMVYRSLSGSRLSNRKTDFTFIRDIYH